MKIQRRQLTESEAKSAITAGEFEESVRGSGANVAVILTQDWCPQWTGMSRWLDGDETAGADLEIDVYELEYNTVGYGDEFMRFKETVFGNALIPYVRYYRNGELVGESNYVSPKKFLSYFKSE